MREILDQIQDWRREGRSIALATVVKVWGSAPRPAGSKMAVAEGGGMAGSVSGGCVESAVVEEAQQVIASGQPKLLTFGVSDDDAWAVGLSCGGEIQVDVEPLAGTGTTGDNVDLELLESLIESLTEEQLVALATIVDGRGRGRKRLIWPRRDALGSLGAPNLDEAADRLAESTWTDFKARRETIETANPNSEADETSDLFVEVHPPRPQLIIIGAVHTAIALITFAKTLGYRTIIVDPRRAFATPERFGEADELLLEWPQKALPKLKLHEATAVAVLSHDLKIDLPALEAVLRSPVRYIGALGSKKTQAKRVARLEEAGFSSEEIDRVHSPIGLDLGGRSPSQIALSVMAQIVAVAHGRD